MLGNPVQHLDETGSADTRPTGIRNLAAGLFENLEQARSSGNAEAKTGACQFHLELTVFADLLPLTRGKALAMQGTGGPAGAERLHRIDQRARAAAIDDLARPVGTQEALEVEKTLFILRNEVDVAAGLDINFMVVEKSAVIKFDKHVASRVFSPDELESLDSYMMKYRKYGIVELFDNKLDGVYVSASTS